MIKYSILFGITALAEIIGCYLMLQAIRRGGDIFLFVAAVGVLIIFAALLTIHPEASGRIYAAYGGIYVAMAIAWLYFVDRITPTPWDIIGAGVSILGMMIIALQPK